ncbi:hypothetical protein ACFX10_032895 [Malus domestica]
MHGFPEKSRYAPRNMMNRLIYACLARKIENQNEEDKVEFENPEHTDLTSPNSTTEVWDEIVEIFVNLSQQVEIVKKCRELDVGPGGFYRPGYQDGAKLRL